MIYSRKDINWKNSKCYIGTKYSGVCFEEHPKHKKMFYIKWEFPKHGYSDDFYNLTRVKDNIVTLVLEDLNKDSPSEIEEPRNAPSSPVH